MPRPRRQCKIQQDVEPRFYKPQGLSMHGMKVMSLSAEALEALRLADAEGLEHVAAAEIMEVSRPTFSRLLTEARSIVATALVEGWALDLKGHVSAEGSLEDGENAPSDNGSHRRCGKNLKRHRGHGHGKPHAGGRGLGPASGGAPGYGAQDESEQALSDPKGGRHHGMRRRRGHTPRWQDAKPLEEVSAGGEGLE